MATKEYLQSIVEESAATLEELRAANEEAQAGNEELETAQEELESVNEELNTLNAELKISNQEFSKVNRDLTNLLESISIPLVMVGRDLRVRRFTRAMEPHAESDRLRCRALHHRSSASNGTARPAPAASGCNGGRQPEAASISGTRTAAGIRFASGLRGADGKTDGAVLMLIDIDAAKRGLDFAEAIVETVREPLVILNQNLQVMKANKSFYETFHAAPRRDGGAPDLRPGERAMEYSETARIAGEHSPRALHVPGF